MPYNRPMAGHEPISDAGLLLGSIFVAVSIVGIGILGTPSGPDQMAAVGTVATAPASSCLKEIKNATTVPGGEDFECLNGCTYIVEVSAFSARPVVNTRGTPDPKGPPGQEYYQALIGKPTGPVECNQSVGATMRANFRDLYGAYGLQAGTPQIQTGLNANNAPGAITKETPPPPSSSNNALGDWSTRLAGAQNSNLPYSAYYKPGDTAGNFGDVARGYQSDAAALANTVPGTAPPGVNTNRTIYNVEQAGSIWPSAPPTPCDEGGFENPCQPRTYTLNPCGATPESPCLEKQVSGTAPPQLNDANDAYGAIRLANSIPFNPGSLPAPVAAPVAVSTGGEAVPATVPGTGAVSPGSGIVSPSATPVTAPCTEESCSWASVGDFCSSSLGFTCSLWSALQAQTKKCQQDPSSCQ